MTISPDVKKFAGEVGQLLVDFSKDDTMAELADVKTLVFDVIGIFTKSPAVAPHLTKMVTEAILYNVTK